MNWLFDTIFGLAWSGIKLYVLTCWLFLAVVKAKELHEAGDLGGFWKYPGVLLAVVFVICNFLFNLVWGTIIFKEKPRYFPWAEKELLFTDRVKRHYRKVAYNIGGKHSPKDMRNYRAALRWKDRLNRVDRNHIY